MASAEVIRHNFQLVSTDILSGNYTFTNWTAVPRFDPGFGTLLQARLYVDHERITKINTYSESTIDYAQVTATYIWTGNTKVGDATTVAGDFSHSTITPMLAGARFEEAGHEVRTTDYLFTDAANLSTFSRPGGALPVTISGKIGLASKPWEAFT